MKRVSQLLIINYSLLVLTSCGISNQISKSAKGTVINDSSLLNAHLGISIYEPASSKYWYNYNGEKYFVPASNTKIPTCYAAMKYLGDSLVGLRYEVLNDSSILIKPSGDPSFGNPEYRNQPGIDFLRDVRKHIIVDFTAWQDDALGSGWSWNDYNESYMAERSIMPVNGNLATIKGTSKHWTFDPLLMGKVIDDTIDYKEDTYLTKVERDKAANIYRLKFGGKTERTIQIPFYTEQDETIAKLLEDIITKRVLVGNMLLRTGIITKFNVIHSQPTDSLLKPMMHRSDNFFAEQSLLMVSNEMLGVMNDAKIIDTILKTDFKDLPQKPRWVDGSGLSRYNLFTPQDLVAILGKMKNEFGMDRIKEVFPTGGEGTISSYYKSDSGFIYAKTGTLSGVVALSGFLTTKKGKQLIFSVLVNNHNNSSSAGVRRAVERFIRNLRDKY